MKALARWGEYGTEGAITLFLSLILAVLFSFLGMSLQSARMAGSRYIFGLASEAAVRSVFASYDSLVWERYRILMLTDRENAQMLAEECMDCYEAEGGLFPVSLSSVRLAQAETFGENGAAAWEEAAISYMKGKLPTEFVSWLWEQSGLAQELEGLTVWLEDFKDLFVPVVELEQKLRGLEEKLEGAMTAFAGIKELFAQIQAASEEWTALTHREIPSETEEGIQENTQENMQEENEARLRDVWERLRELTGRIGEDGGQLSEELAGLAAEAAGGLEGLTQLRGQLEDFAATVSGQGDSQGLLALSGMGDYIVSLTQRTDFLEELPASLLEQGLLLERLGEFKMPAYDGADPDRREEILSQLLSFLEEAQTDEWAELETGQSDSQAEGTEQDKKNLRSLLDLKSWMDRGILHLVLPDGASLSEAELSGALLRRPREEETPALIQTYRNLLYGEYALRYTADYTEDTDGAGLIYETEYLIAGGDSDQANLAAAASQLLLVRGTANLLYLLKDLDSRNRIQVIAEGIALVLGGLVPVPLIMVFLMVLWALGEAVCDVRTLLAGDRVPLLKDASSWRLSFDSLLSLTDQGFVRGRGTEGMSYEEYLRFLLFFVPLTEKCYRTMELAQENIAALKSGFQIESAVSRACMEISGQAMGQEMTLSLTYGYG